MDLTLLWFGMYKAAKYALHPLSWITITGLLTLLNACLPMTPKRITWVRRFAFWTVLLLVLDRHTDLILHVYRVVGRMVSAIQRDGRHESRRCRRAGRRCVCEGIAQTDRGCLGFLTPTHRLWRRLVDPGSRPQAAAHRRGRHCISYRSADIS